MTSLKKYRTLSKESKSRIVKRYALFQIPDMAILVLVLILLQLWIDFPLWLFWGLISFWIIKEVLIFPFVWRAYDQPPPRDMQSLIGTEGVAEERLNPSGYIRVHGELWKAEVMEKGIPIEKGDTVLVEGAYGFTLLVQLTQKK